MAGPIDAAVAIRNAFRREMADIDAVALGRLSRLQTLGLLGQTGSRRAHP